MLTDLVQTGENPESVPGFVFREAYPAGNLEQRVSCKRVIRVEKTHGGRKGLSKPVLSNYFNNTRETTKRI